MIKLKLIKKIDWEKVNNLIPAIIQDSKTQKVLMMGFMNREALEKTLEEKVVWFFSRTKQRLWKKGETSNNILQIENINTDISLDCDNDTLLIQAIPAGPTCHTGEISCFKGTPLQKEENNNFKLSDLFLLLEQRKNTLPENSYSTLMFTKGNEFIGKKLIEETGEIIEEIENILPEKVNKQRLIEESCDLVFHLFALNVENNIVLADLEKELELRNSEDYLHKSKQ